MIPPRLAAAWREAFPDPLGCALWTGACLAASLAGNALVAGTGYAPPFWPAAGLAFAFIESESGPALPLIWLTELLGSLAFGPLTAAVWLVTGCQALAAATGVRLWRNYREDGALWDNGRSMFAFICIAALAQGLFPATIRFFAPLADGAFPLAATHPLWPRQAALGWLNWFCAYVAGVLLVTPLLSAWRDAILNPENDRFRETFFLTFGLLVMAWSAFSGASTLTGYGCLPLALIAAFLLPPRSLTTLLLFAASVAAVAAYAGLPRRSGAGADILAAASTFSLALPAATLVLFSLVRQARRQHKAIERLREELASTDARVELRVQERTADVSRALVSLQADLEDLHVSQMRDASMFENAVQGMFECTLDGALLRTNPALEQMLGYAGPIETVAVDIAAEHFYQTEDFAALVKELRARGALRNYEIKLRRADGYPLWALASLRLRVAADQGAYMEGALIDATSQKIAEERLKRSEERLRRILNATSEGFLFMDKDRRVRDANVAICCATGYERHELIGKPLEELLAPTEKQQPAAAGLDAYEANLLTRQGPPTPVLVHAGALEDEQFGVEAHFVFCTDITVLKRAEALREDVERITRHDLKTPLNAIINLPKLLHGRGQLPPEDEELLRMIEDAGYRMLRLVNLSLDLYKMENGVYKVEPREVDILPLLNAIGFELKGLISALDIALEISLAGRAPASGDAFLVWAEELLCYTMLANLLKNALEAAPEASLVRVDLYEREGAACVSFSNQGEIPENVRERMFEKYATAGKDVGTGLGAYSARLIARTQGGDVVLEPYDDNEPGVVTVTARLPRSPASLASPQEVTLQGETP